MDGRKPRHRTTTINTSKRAIIIGGSIAGLSCGLALLKTGWDVQIFEATEGELEQRGAGIITHQALFDVLKHIGVSTEQDIGVSIVTRKAFSKSGDITDTLELPQIATSWGRMYELLRRHFPDERYHQNKVLERFKQSDNKVDAYFTDGTTKTADLLVAADGIRSTVRSVLEPDAQPEYAGYIAWRGLIEEHDLSTLEQKDLLPYFTFCLPEGEQVLTYPIAGKQHQTGIGKRRYNVVWYRPAAKETTLQDLLTDIDGNNNGVSIAPDKVRPEIIQQMRHDADRLLSPQHINLINKLDNPFIQPIYDLTTNKMVHQNVVLTGDAAFTARPHLGVGITKAAEDAFALASALESHTDQSATLKQFENHRQPRGRSWVKSSRELGAYLQAQLLSDEERHFANLHRTTDAVMRETASPFV